MTKKKLTIYEVDREFGGSPNYWYGLLSISMKNRKCAEDIIARIQADAVDRNKRICPR